MTDSTNTAGDAPATRPWPWALTVAAAAAVAAVAEVFLLFTANRAVLRGTLFDPDCYLHLHRALRLMTQGAWPEAIDPRLNAPFGFSIHWSALFDLLLVAGAAPLRLFGLDPHGALFLWGCAISPVLLVVALAVFAGGVRRWVSGAAFLWLVMLLFTQPQLAGVFFIGRPDHHSLVIGLLLVQFAWVTAWFGGDTRRAWTVAAGVAAGLQMITSVEALLTVLVVALSFAIAWAVFQARTLKPLPLYLGACVATIAAWLAFDRGGAMLTPFYDRISIVQLAALGFGALAIAGVSLLEVNGAARRLAALAVASVLAVAATALLYPDFFRGPWPHPVPAIVAWHATIVELQPLLPTSGHRLAQFLAQFAAPLLSLPLIVMRLRRREPFLLVSAVGFVVFGAVALFQMRWSAELQAATLLPWTLTTIALWRSTAALTLGSVVLPLRTLLLGGAMLLQVLPANLAQVQTAAFAGRGGCDWRSAIGALRSVKPADGIVLASIWQGSEILWRTDLKVLAAPYEIPPALIDNAVFERGNAAALRRLVQARHIDFVLVCTSEPSAAVIDRANWLAPLPMAVPGFQLYRVVKTLFS